VPKTFSYGDLTRVRTAVNLSPEALAPYFGVTNMTLRRWAAERDLSKPVPDRHTPAIRNGLFRLYGEGKLSLQDSAVGPLLEQMQPLYFGTILNSLGVDIHKLDAKDFRKSAVRFLKMVAKEFVKNNSPSRLREQVKAMRVKTRDFAREITFLLRIVEGKVDAPQKAVFVAIGALVYLVVPFDLIPDSLPGIGLLDDFALLSVAVAYCNPFVQGEGHDPKA